eukprot:TRINITY_DN5197_c0_g1_i4.p1 TRINITY_DN5197_c0_g1~~TRINITY_DN5197_c0_g1_i4.p1  ORF type:complete len:121 (-),score=31.56 TRINITY_DN5197_c0_g1_i4:151-513(-)
MESIKEEVDQACIEFISSAPAKIQLFEAKARALATTVVPSTQDGIPTSLLAEFDEFEAAQREMSVLLFQLKKYILLRVPEIKDEDNAGVRVQEAVLGVVNGPKEEKKTEEAGFSDPTFVL